MKIILAVLLNNSETPKEVSAEGFVNLILIVLGFAFLFCLKGFLFLTACIVHSFLTYKDLNKEYYNLFKIIALKHCALPSTSIEFMKETLLLKYDPKTNWKILYLRMKSL